MFLVKFLSHIKNLENKLIFGIIKKLINNVIRFEIY